MSRRQRMIGKMGFGFSGGGGLSLPYSVDFSTLADGPLPAVFKGSGGAIATGKAVITPTEGIDMVTNGTFTSWTADNPDSWSIQNGPELAGDKVTENPAGQCEIIRATKIIGIYQNMGMTTCDLYRCSRNVTAFGAGQGLATMGGVAGIMGSYFGVMAGTGIVTEDYFPETAPTGTLTLYANGATTDMTLDDVSIRRLSNYMYLLPPTRSDVSVKGTFTLATGNPLGGVIARANGQTSPTDYIAAFAKRGANTIRLVKMVNGILSLVANAGLSYVAGALLELRCVGTSISVWYNNGEVIAAQTINEATINNNNIHGFGSSNGGNSLNSFFLHSSTVYNTVFLGGSNTVGIGVDSWTTLLSSYLDQHLTSNEYNKGYSGTPSWYGLVRLQDDVIAHNPNVVFMDFAVNDSGDASNTSRAGGWIACAEAMIKRLRTSLPNARLIFLNLVQQDEFLLSQGYRDSRDKWVALCTKYAVEAYRIDLWLQGVLGTTTPTALQCAVYGDEVHFTATGHGQIYAMLLPHLGGYPGGAGWSGNLADYGPDLYADTGDWTGTPINRNGIDNDGETGAGWSTVSTTSRQSSTANDTIAWTGTFSGFGIDAGWGAGAGTVGWSIDGGAYTNINLSTWGVAAQSIYSVDRGVHTVTLKVISGTVKINKFLAV